MRDMHTESLDAKIRDAFTTFSKLDEVDVKILEGLSLLGPRNFALVAKHLGMPPSTVRYRIGQMLDNSLLFLHLNPYHTHMGLKKAVVFIEAVQGYESLLLDCLRVNDFWLYLCRIYGPYEGWGGVWTVPKENVDDFSFFFTSLVDLGVARSVEVNWTTCHDGIPVKSRWFSIEEKRWVFNWDEWMKEVETIDGELPYTLVEPDDWPIKVDYVDLLIIKELEIDGRKSFVELSKILNIPLETVKYRFREHISKRGLIEDYQIEIYRFHSLSSESLFFKFEFDSYENFKKFALSLRDKPFPTFMGKVLGQYALISHINLPKIEFRKFIESLSTLIQKGLLKRYHYVIQDLYLQWRETIPYQHFENGRWKYDAYGQREELENIIRKSDWWKKTRPILLVDGAV